MKRIIFVLAFMVALTGCGLKGFKSTSRNSVAGSGVRKTEKREVAAFTALEISGGFEVEIVCQKEHSLEIEGDDNLLPLVKTEVKNGTLYISDTRPFSSGKPIRIRIAAQDIVGLSTAGANKITLDGVKNEGLVIESSGASRINASGETKLLQLEMSGAGKVNVQDLRASKVTISSSGAGRAEVYATEEVNAEVSGAASVTYYGEPKVVNKSVSGVGSVNKG